MFFLRGSISSAQAQGPRRYQEDYLVCLSSAGKKSGRSHLLGILDGHGGKEVARYCAETLPQLFDPAAEDPEQELKNVVGELADYTDLSKAGSTLSLAFVDESRGIVTTAVLGDSPIIVITRDGTIERSEEHNVRTNEAEREAAVRRGAIYLDNGYIVADRYGDGLQLSRALGDCNLKTVLDRTPVIRSYRIGFNGLVLIASDGLFDPNHNDSSDEDLEAFVVIAQDGGDAADILRYREEQGLEDNTSIILWKPKKWWGWF